MVLCVYKPMKQLNTSSSSRLQAIPLFEAYTLGTSMLLSASRASVRYVNPYIPPETLVGSLTLTVLVTTIDALCHFETG